jgi:hypothetical protein
MAAGDILTKYVASSNLTVTNLNSLAASSTLLGGWESALVDNSSAGYVDYAITGKLTTSSANRQAGRIRVYAVRMLDDSTWPDAFDGTESAESVATTGVRDNVCKLGAEMTVTNANGEVAEFSFKVAALFGGICPAKFVLFVTGDAATSTNAQLAASGNQITIKGEYHQVAQS